MFWVEGIEFVEAWERVPLLSVLACTVLLFI